MHYKILYALNVSVNNTSNIMQAKSMYTYACFFKCVLSNSGILRCI